MFGDMDPDMDPGMWRDWFGMGRSERGKAVRRGDVRDAILTALAREPMHGYRIIQQLSEQSGGRWRPSAGSVYPTLQQLEDEGLVTSEEGEGRRVFSLTEAGRAAAETANERGGPRWDVAPTGRPSGADQPDADTAAEPAAAPPAGLREALQHLNTAAAQAAQVGSPETVAGTKIILADARKAIYRLLAEEDEPGAG
jgi:DNA-binding PadR family transcriptional regulator